MTPHDLTRIRAHIRSEERRLENEKQIGAETRDTEERLATLRAVRESIEVKEVENVHRAGC